MSGERKTGWGPSPILRSRSLEESEQVDDFAERKPWEDGSQHSTWGPISGAGSLPGLGAFGAPRRHLVALEEDTEDWQFLKEATSVPPSMDDQEPMAYSHFSPSPLPSPLFQSRSLPIVPFAQHPPAYTAATDNNIENDRFHDAPSPVPIFQSQSQEESRRHPSEQPSRTLFVRNVSTLSDKDLRSTFAEYGAVQNLYTASKNRGFVMVTFYDIRDADSAKLALNGRQVNDRNIDIHYSIPKDSAPKDPQAGFVLLQTTASDDEVRASLSPYGEIKEIRDSPKAKGHKIVEFFDTRNSDTLLSFRVRIGDHEVQPKPVTYQNLRKAGQSQNNNNNRANQQPLRHRARSQSLDQVQASWQQDNRLPRDRGARSPQQRTTPEQFLLHPERVLSGQDRRTTLMIKNIPNKYTQKMLLSTVEEFHRSSFDFIYLPIDFRNWCNVGYAFINFVRPEEIVAFYENFHGKKWKHFNSDKICQIAYARIQGKESLIDHFQSSNLLGEDKRCRPMVFEDGRSVPFPARKSK